MKFEPQLEGEFNSGLAIVFLIDSLKRGLITARLDNDYQQRYDLLVEYFGELAGQCGSNKKEQEQLDKHLLLWEQAKTALARIIDAQMKNEKKISTKELEIFDYWQYELKRFQQFLGIGMPKKADPRFAMGN